MSVCVSHVHQYIAVALLFIMKSSSWERMPFGAASTTTKSTRWLRHNVHPVDDELIHIFKNERGFIHSCSRLGDAGSRLHVSD